MGDESILLYSILQNVRGALGLTVNDPSFDSEIVLHINAALATLVQNGVGTALTVIDSTQTWDQFKNVEQVSGNEMFEQVKLYVFIKTKILFDPPPPSTIKYMSDGADEILWRLRESYDIPTIVV